jgi:hypothetical protein
MTKEELGIIKTRLACISDKKMQEIYASSGAAYKLLQAIPVLLAYISGLTHSSDNIEVYD